ncbi:MAG: hypothetical protein V3S97_00330 [Candidatus Bathyarchaeia archaeon]
MSLKMEIKYFVSYGTFKPELGGAEGEKKAMAEWSKTVDELGMKVVLWGSPYGTSENAICVMKGTVENFTKLANLDPPYIGSRTNMVITW